MIHEDKIAGRKWCQKKIEENEKRRTEIESERECKKKSIIATSNKQTNVYIYVCPTRLSV